MFREEQQIAPTYVSDSEAALKKAFEILSDLSGVKLVVEIIKTGYYPHIDDIRISGCRI